MEVSAASRRTSLQLHRVSALLWGHVVEAKLQALDRAVKANFDPNHPASPPATQMAANGPTWAGAAVARRRTCALPKRGVVAGVEAATQKQRRRNWQFGTSGRHRLASR